VNVAAGRTLFTEYTGVAPRDASAPAGPSPDDTVIAHPTYGSLGWLAVINPGPNTEADLRRLLRSGWEAARSRFDRRQAAGSTSQELSEK
jgi:hypothetical protein